MSIAAKARMFSGVRKDSNLRISRTGTDALPFCKATLRGVRCRKGPYFARVKGYPASPRTIGESIRKRRLDLGLRQIDVARIIGCNEMTIVNWEKGHTCPRVNKMTGVYRFLDPAMLKKGFGA